MTVQQKRAVLVKRPIEHPLWKFEVWSETVTRMAALPDGATTFRPAQGRDCFLKINMTVGD
jgi:hypothetical protein